MNASLLRLLCCSFIMSAAPRVALAETPGAPMAVTVGGIDRNSPNIDAQLDALKVMGVTSIQTYLYWNKVEKAPGVMDWSEYDAEVALLQKHRLKWVPFIVAGPWYLTPEFVRQDPEITPYRCLEHGRPSKIVSLWSPRMRDYVTRYLKAFAEHYRPMGVLESVNLGISGDYGEAIYSVWGNWPGAYHSHAGYWCGDDRAVADFRRRARSLYPAGIKALNQAWQTHFDSFDEIKPFLPGAAPSERAWQEELSWYRGAMAQYAEFWMKTARSLFPGTDLYLCTGGDMSPEHGSDFSADAKVAASVGGGMRITNEASSFPMNVRLTRLVDSSCRFYGAYVGHEPAAVVTPAGMLGRIFNAVSSGARQLFMYFGDELVTVRDGRGGPGPSGRFVQDNQALFRTVVPRVETAFYYPRPSSRQAGAERLAGELTSDDFGDLACEIRHYLDYDFVDDRMIQDGALGSKKVLIIADARIMDRGIVAKVGEWVRTGGVAYVLNSRPSDWDGQSGAFDALVGFTADTDDLAGVSMMTVAQPTVLTGIAALKDLIVTHGYTGLSADCAPLLTMQYEPKASAAWQRRVGKGRIYAYYGSMELKQPEHSWIVVHKLPLRFLDDTLHACVRDGTLPGLPVSFHPEAEDLYAVQTDQGVWLLNMGDKPARVDRDRKTFVVPALSIARPWVMPGRE